MFSKTNEFLKINDIKDNKRTEVLNKINIWKPYKILFIRKINKLFIFKW